MSVVADSHAIVWYLQGSERLSSAAGEALDAAERSHEIVVSVVTFIDLWYVSQTTRAVTAEQLAALRERLDSSEAARIEPVSLAVVDAMTGIPRDAFRDPWDRLIVATALTLEASLVTADSAIIASGLVPTIW